MSTRSDNTATNWYLGKFAFTVTTGPRWNRSRLERFWSAIGNGGQRLFVLPGLDLVVAITGGNYDTPDQWGPADPCHPRGCAAGDLVERVGATGRDGKMAVGPLYSD